MLENSMQDQQVDCRKLLELFKQLAKRHGVSAPTEEAFSSILLSDTVTELLKLPTSVFNTVLVNDAYKATMHQMYAEYLTGVTADFALHVRKAPITLDDLYEHFPQLHSSLLQTMGVLHHVDPYSPQVLQALRMYFNFEPSQAMLERAHKYGVAPVEWPTSCGGHALWHATGQQCVAVSSGPVEAASHTETNVMQAVQSYIIKAQVEAIAGQTGVRLGRTQLLANSLCKLALVVDKLNGVDHGLQLALYAGRRTSDKLYLLLQNLIFAQTAKGYIGTSSIYAATILDQVWQQLGVPELQRRKTLGPLVGTHAHEQSSMLQQLLAEYDAEAGRQGNRSNQHLLEDHQRF